MDDGRRLNFFTAEARSLAQKTAENKKSLRFSAKSPRLGGEQLNLLSSTADID